MDIGLLDVDAILYPEDFFPNLEIMKLSAYYKKKRHIVTLILNPKETQRFSKIIIRKDIQDGRYPSYLLTDPRCSYGGLAFTGGKYIPMEDEIEDSAPDFSIYNSFYNKVFKYEEDGERKFKAYEKGGYARIERNGKISPAAIREINRTKPGGRTYFYDEDIGESRAVAKFLSEFSLENKKLYFRHPQQTTNFENLKLWGKSKSLMALNSLVFARDLTGEEFKELVEEAKIFKFHPLIGVGFLTKEEEKDSNIVFARFKKDFKRVYYSGLNNCNLRFKVHKRLTNTIWFGIFTILTQWYNGSALKKESASSFFFKKLRTGKMRVVDEWCFADEELFYLMPRSINKIKEEGGEFQYDPERD